MSLCLVLWGASAKAALGDLDTTFGGDGIVLFDSGDDQDDGVAVAIDADGNILFAGSIINGTDLDFEVLRYTPLGELDTTFGVGGIVTTDMGSSVDDTAVALEIDADGNIVVGGQSANAGNTSAYAVVRYTSLGVLDTTFGGGDGIVTTPALNTNDLIYAMAIDADGNVLLGGSFSGSSLDFALVRYTSAGVLDTSFGGGDGIVTEDLGVSTADSLYGVVINADGEIVTAGKSAALFALARFTSAGVADGVLTTDVGGTPNSSFGSLALDVDGNMVIGGSYFNGTDFDVALIRYTSAGALDTTNFGGGTGFVTSDSGSDDFCISLAIDANGNILCGGHHDNGTDDDFALLRYTSAGVLDVTFNTSGIVSNDVGSGTNDDATSLAIDADANLVLAGTSTNGTNGDFAMMRILGTECSNGVIEGSETCDDGASNSDTTADACRTTCVVAACGDTVVDTGETCDDGNTTAGDGCSDLCATESDTTDAATSGGGGCALNSQANTPHNGYLVAFLLLVAVASAGPVFRSKVNQS